MDSLNQIGIVVGVTTGALVLYDRFLRTDKDELDLDDDDIEYVRARSRGERIGIDRATEDQYFN
ncbi:MAG: hypothetical protein ACOCRX_03235 [Candidatus Woesearchaeota archaeon]